MSGGAPGQPGAEVASGAASEGAAPTASTAHRDAGASRRGTARPWWRRRSVADLLAVLALGAAEQLLLPPRLQPSARAVLAAIDGYQAVLSPRLGAAGVRCRFTPTCSRYAEAVIRRDGAAVGVVRAAGRLLRCGPWTPAGTVDPP